MKIIRVINTNAVVTVDNHKKEIIVTGSGIGFRKKRGENLDESLIDKVYCLQNNENSRKLQEFVETFSEQYLDITEKVIQTAKQDEGLDINDMIYITLTDHINSALERYQSGIKLKNIIKTDIQKFYSKEFKIGRKAITWIYEKTGIDLGDDEAGFIAMHIIASESSNNFPINVQKMIELITSILQIVRLHFKIEFNEDSFSYQRLITHLKFFSMRIFDGLSYKDSMHEIYNTFVSQNEHIYSGVLKISEFIYKKYDYILNKDESLYLMIHLKRILDEQQEIKNKK